MTGQRSLSRSTLLRCQNQDVHFCAFFVLAAFKSASSINIAELAGL
jgi:hypothetical protein